MSDVNVGDGGDELETAVAPESVVHLVELKRRVRKSVWCTDRVAVS